MRIFVTNLLVWAMFSCQSSPENVAKNYFEIANKTVKGDTSETIYLKNHLSKSAKKVIDEIPFLMQYSLLTTTKKGSLGAINILSSKQINADSVVLEMELQYADKSKKRFNQAMVYEQKEWKLGLSTKQ
jgi:hypothetical protein